jgi:hypothetical protein
VLLSSAALLCWVITGDSIDLEYSDWELSQQQIERSAALPSYDLAVDLQPLQPAAAAAAAFAAAEEFDAVPVAVETASAAGHPADADADDAGGVDIEQAAAAATDDGCSYSINFASMSLQQSVLSDLPDPSAAAAAAAPPAAVDASVADDAVEQHSDAAGSASRGGSSSGSPDLSHVRPSFRSKFDPLMEELKYTQQLRAEAAASLAGQLHEEEAPAQQQQQQQQVIEEQAVTIPQLQQQQEEAAEDVADAICSAAFDRVFAQVLSEAVDMCSHGSQQQQRPASTVAQQQQQQQQEASAATAATADSSSSVETADTADSSSGSKSIQLDWQSSPGSPPPYLSPMTLRAAAAAAAAANAAAASTPDAESASPPPIAAAGSDADNVSTVSSRQWLVSHPPTDWTPLSDDAATPWSVEAAASSRYGAGSSVTAPDDAAAAEVELGLGRTVKQLDSLLSQAAAESDFTALAAANMQEQQQQQQLAPTTEGGVESAVVTVPADTAATAAAGCLAADGSQEGEDEAAAADGLPLSSARAAAAGSEGSSAADDDEFDWPGTEQVRQQGLLRLPSSTLPFFCTPPHWQPATPPTLFQHAFFTQFLTACYQH